MPRRVRPLLTSLTILSLACIPALAQAEVIGLAVPLSGSSAQLGAQMRDGANAAVNAISDRPVTLDVRDDLCTAEGGAQAARAFVEAKAVFVVGFLCHDAIAAALPILSAANIPVITPGVRTDSLTDGREKSGWPVYRLAPRDDGEARAVADLLLPQWRSELFAVVDDGTIYGRDLAESFRATAETSGLQPVFTDNYRPQLENQIGLVGRLRRAGATRAFVGGDREDVAIMGRDAAQLGYALQIAGGEALRAATVNTAPAVDTLMVAPPDWSKAGRAETLQALRDAGIEPDGYVLPTYAAVEVVVTALTDAETSDQTLRQILDREAFTTAIGEIRFDPKGDLAENPYRLYRFDGTDFVEEAP